MNWDALGISIENISTNEDIFPKKLLFCFINGVLLLLSENNLMPMVKKSPVAENVSKFIGTIFPYKVSVLGL